MATDVLVSTFKEPENKLFIVWHAMSVVKIYYVFVRNSCLAMSAVSLGKYYALLRCRGSCLTISFSLELYKPAGWLCSCSFR